MPETTILDDSAVSEIEALSPFSYANGTQGVVITLNQRDALVATVKHLRAENDEYERRWRNQTQRNHTLSQNNRELQSQLDQLRGWKESAMTLLSRYDSIAETFGGKLGSSKIDNLERGVEQLRAENERLQNDALKLSKALADELKRQ